MSHSLRANRLLFSASTLLLLAGSATLLCRAQLAPITPPNTESINPPINYKKSKPTDAIARLQQKIDAGEVKLPFEKAHGYLPAVLKALGIPESSQALVFSKTSFQREDIAPWRPRALYFNNDAYVGWVQQGAVLEVASVDKDLGVVFYTLDQRESATPQFYRQSTDCLQCHQGSMTDNVPGLVIRSTPTGADGTPMLNQPNFLTTLASPFSERWGGWYVTGKVGAMRHMGNLIMHAGEGATPLARDGMDDLPPNVGEGVYLAPGSDIVSLLVLTHQAELHNRITKVAYLLRGTEETVGSGRSTTTRPGTPPAAPQDLAAICEPLVRSLLFCGEVPLPDPIKGSSDFAQKFAAVGPRDTKGRSLRDLDLTTRLFKYPCSYLIYSESFAALPPAAKDVIYQRLWQILSGKDDSPDFAHLSAADRQSIREILRDTLPALPAYWKNANQN